jgi:DNA end-binding protein Ku
MKKYCKDCQAELGWNDPVRGTEVDGKLVIVSDDEKVELEGKIVKYIEILQMVEPTEIDPLQFENGYFVGSAEGGKSYTLLAQSMATENVWALARFALRTKYQLAVIRPDNGKLILHTMRWPDEVRVPEGLLGPGADFTAKQMQSAIAAVQSMKEPYDPRQHTDDFQEKLLELVAAKAEGAPMVAEPAVELDATEVDDLVAMLEQTARERAKKRHPAARKTPAKKAPAAKAPARRRGAA